MPRELLRRSETGTHAPRCKGPVWPRLELYERSAVCQPLRLHHQRASVVVLAFANEVLCTTLSLVALSGMRTQDVRLGA